MNGPPGNGCEAPAKEPRQNAAAAKLQVLAHPRLAPPQSASTLDGWRVGESPAEVLLEAIAAQRRALAEHDVMLALLAQGIAAGAISVYEGLRLLGDGNR